MTKIIANNQNNYPIAAKYSQLNENKNIQILLDYGGSLPI